MNYLSVYAFVQIVGESFPISSSGNVKLWTTLCSSVSLLDLPSITFSKNIDFLLHIPTLIILLIFFWKRWTSYLPRYACSFSFFMRVCLWVLLVDSITCFFYIALHLSDLTSYLPLSVGFLLTAASLYSTRFCKSTQQSTSPFTFTQALAFGCIQSIALFPGISRFATTFALGRWYGYKAQDAFWYSFMIQIPLLIGAAFRGLYAYHTYPWYQAEYLVPYGIVLLASVIAYVGLCFVSLTIDRCTLWKFSCYALITAALAWYLGL